MAWALLGSVPASEGEAASGGREDHQDAIPHAGQLAQRCVVEHTGDGADRPGNVRTSTLALRSNVLEPPPIDLIATDAPVADRAPSVIVAFHGRFIVTALRSPRSEEPIPAIRVHRSRADGVDEHVGSLVAPSLQRWYDDRPHLLNARALAITEIRLDDAVASSSDARRCAVFYSSGQWAILDVSFTSTAVTAVELCSHLALPTLGEANDPAFDVVRAQLHSPLVATCTAAGVVAFWRIEDGARPSVELVQPSLRSSGSVWSPLVLSLTRLGDDDESRAEEDEYALLSQLRKAKPPAELRFRAAIAYATPYFPRAWTVAVQVRRAFYKCALTW